MQTLKPGNNSKPIRRMTVCCKAFDRVNKSQRGRPALFPSLRLSGKWLQATGFQIGHVVDIMCEQGRLTITIAKEQKYAALQKLFQKEKIEIV